MSLGANALGQSRFEVPEACGTAAEFRSELERLIGTAAGAAMPAVVAIVPGAEGGYGLRLELGDEVRELEDPDCRTLFQSAVVIAAAAWRGESAQAAHDLAPPETEAAKVAPPSRSTPAPAPPAASRSPGAPPLAGPAPALGAPPPMPGEVTEPRRGIRSGVSIGAGVSGGVVPAVGAVVALGVILEPAPWGASFTLRHWPERRASRAGRSVDVTALGGRAAGLIRLTPSAQMSVGLEINRLSGTGGESVSRRGSDAAWQIAPSLGLAVIPWSVGHLRLELGALGRASLVRPHFVVNGFGDVYAVPPFGADAILQGVWLFP